jgi:hypothetical protein
VRRIGEDAFEVDAPLVRIQSLTARRFRLLFGREVALSRCPREGVFERRQRAVDDLDPAQMSAFDQLLIPGDDFVGAANEPNGFDGGARPRS